MSDVSNILGRLRELSMQAASDGVTDTQRGYIDTERSELVSEIDRIAGEAEYNGVALLDGTLSAVFQVGLDAGDTLTVDQATAVDSTGLGVDASDFTTRASLHTSRSPGDSPPVGRTPMPPAMRSSGQGATPAAESR